METGVCKAARQGPAGGALGIWAGPCQGSDKQVVGAEQWFCPKVKQFSESVSHPFPLLSPCPEAATFNFR